MIENKVQLKYFQNPENTTANRSFLYGDGVWVVFYLRNSKLILAEESYFFLMASMRKMRMDIPLSYTLEYFTNLFENVVVQQGITHARIKFFAYRSEGEEVLSKRPVEFYFEVEEVTNPLAPEADYELDIIKEISIKSNLLSPLYTHCPENIYAEIYAYENDLDDVIFLNSEKRVARTGKGNILLLNDKTVSVVKPSEGAYISPLLESFVTYLDKNIKALISETEFIGFQTQKAEEVLVISELHGLHHVTKIRNKTFPTERFAGFIKDWQESL